MAWNDPNTPIDESTVSLSKKKKKLSSAISDSTSRKKRSSAISDSSDSTRKKKVRAITDSTCRKMMVFRISETDFIAVEKYCHKHRLSKNDFLIRAAKFFMFKIKKPKVR
jgi:hypothetical protein